MNTLQIESLSLIAYELTLFSASIFLISGISDATVDLIWTGRGLWRRCFVYRVHQRADAYSLSSPKLFGRIVFFVPAWDEGAVLGAMLRHMVSTLGEGHWLVYVGVYPNDAATLAAATSISDPRIRIVIGQRPGPTTKADCLNNLWQRMLADEMHGIM